MGMHVQPWFHSVGIAGASVDKTELTHQTDMLDHVTNAMFSISFLQAITPIVFDGQRRDLVSVGRFYDEWLATTKAGEPKIPFSLGAFVGYMYCGLLITKEHWIHLVPDTSAAESPAEWGLAGVRISAPRRPTPTLQYVIRRMRNALGHGNFRIVVPEDLKIGDDVMRRVSIKFHDVNVSQPEDTFDVELILDQIAKLVKSFHGAVYPEIKRRIAAVPTG